MSMDAKVIPQLAAHVHHDLYMAYLCDMNLQKSWPNPSRLPSKESPNLAFSLVFGRTSPVLYLSLPTIAAPFRLAASTIAQASRLERVQHHIAFARIFL